MSKTAFIFPGQGAQYVGMGKDFYDLFPVCREIFELAGKASGLNIEELCFVENDNINITEYTQIAMLTVEVAMMHAVMERGIKPDLAAGLSLGEYAALAASKAIELEDLFRIIRKRGIFMQEAVPTGGAMTAVLGADSGLVEQVCREIQGEVSVANYNCPGQIVITGEEGAVKEAAEKLAGLGAKRCIPLKVSGPFHSPLLKGAGEKLAQELSGVVMKEMCIPYVTNVTGDVVNNSGEIKELLSKQVASSVKWQQCVEKMIEEGVTTFVEIGPGKTLAGFLKKIDKSANVINIEKVEDLEKLGGLIC